MTLAKLHSNNENTQKRVPVNGLFTPIDAQHHVTDQLCLQNVNIERMTSGWCSVSLQTVCQELKSVHGCMHAMRVCVKLLLHV